MSESGVGAGSAVAVGARVALGSDEGVTCGTGGAGEGEDGNVIHGSLLLLLLLHAPPLKRRGERDGWRAD